MNLKLYFRLASVVLLLLPFLSFTQGNNMTLFARNTKSNTDYFSKSDSTDFSKAVVVKSASTKFDLNSLKNNPIYGLVEDYKEGFSRIRKNQVYGFINDKGEEIITPQYDYAEPFNHGKALTKKFFWQFVDKNGNESEVLKGVKEAKALSEGISIVTFENGKSALIDNNFDQTLKPISDEFDEISVLNAQTLIVSQKNKFGLVTIFGKEKLPLTYEKIIKINESDEWMIIKKGGKYGLVDIAGEALINTEYDKIETFSMFSIGSKAYLNLLATNEKGLRLIEINNRNASKQYQRIDNLNQFALAKVMLKDKVEKFGYIDILGNEVILPNFIELGNFSKFGLVIANNHKKESTLFDSHGKEVLSESPNTTYAHTDTLFSSGLIAIKVLKEGDIAKFHLIDRKQMKPITTEPYSSISKFGNYLAFQKNDKWGLMEKNGNIILNPEYEQFLFESEETFGVKYGNEKYGFIDNKGKIKVSFEMKEIAPFEGGAAIVSKGNNKFGVVNHIGAKIIPLVFKSIVRENQQFVINSTDDKFIVDFKGDCKQNCDKYYEVLKKVNKK
jgi:hypothetical protein